MPFHKHDLGEDFVADYEDLKAFRAFAENRGFQYTSEAEAHIKELDKIAEGEEYERLEKPLNRLIEEIDKIEEQHWEDNEDLIAWRLTFDVLEKAFGRKAAIAYDITVDPQLLEARRILADDGEYEMWFQKREIGVSEEDSIVQEDDVGEIH